MKVLMMCLVLFSASTKAMYHRLRLGLFVSAVIVLIMCGLIDIYAAVWGSQLSVGGHLLTATVGSGRLSIKYEDNCDILYDCAIYTMPRGDPNTIHRFYGLDATVLVNRWGIEVIAGGYYRSASRGWGLSIHLLYIALLSCIVCAIFFPYRRAQSPRQA